MGMYRADYEDAQELSKLMRACDKDNSGSINMQEFLGTRALSAYFSVRGLDIKDAETLFNMCAQDCGEIPSSALVAILLQLRGSASSLDLHLLRYKVDAMQNKHDNM